MNANYVNSKVKVILISLDFKSQLDTKLIPFLKERNIKSEVLLLDDLDYDSWINLVHTDWQGAIPATLIINNGKKIKKFIGGELTLQELNENIQTVLNN